MKFGDLDVGPPPQIPREAYAARRRRLAKAMGEGNALVVATHTPKTFSNDVEYTFRPHSDFWYLTGFAEPGAVLVLEGGSGRSTLFLRDRKPEEEIWTGRRLGAARAADTLGLDAAHAVEELGSRLGQVLSGVRRVHGLARHDPATQLRLVRAAGRRLVAEPKKVQAGGPKSGLLHRRQSRPSSHASLLLHDLRLIKEPAELRMLQKACDLGVAAHEVAARRVVPGAPEYHVEAAFAHHARHHGSNGIGYPSICGCGANAAVLHYVSNLDALRRDRVFLVDAGCEWGYYTSDITRTYPVGGRFTPVQARLYDLVLDAHQAAMRKVRPGNRFRDPHNAAVGTIVDGLLDLGYLKGRRERILKEESYRSFFMHGTSHFLGLDVHDVGHRQTADGRGRVLQEGMVLTVEPGLYFNTDYADCPPGTAGIGIRIEDDVSVTAGGHRNLTRRLPVERSDVEAMVPRKR